MQVGASSHEADIHPRKESPRRKNDGALISLIDQRLPVDTAQLTHHVTDVRPCRVSIRKINP